MTHKLTRRLILCFSLVLLLFAILVGAMFTVLFSMHSAAIYAEDLEAHAVSIADTISRFYQDYTTGSCGGGGFRAYFRFIQDVARCEIWLADAQLQPAQFPPQASSAFQSALPEGSGDFISQIFASDRVCVLDSSISPHMSSLIVGVPVHDADGSVIFALLLRRTIDHQERAYRAGLGILMICLLSAFGLSILLAVLISRRLITPLHQMIRATQQMMSGQYAVSTGVTQDDEMGTLARHIDALSARLLSANQAQQELDASRREFFSNVSHELRTPISVLKGSLEVLVGGLISDPDEVQAYLRQMLSDTNHMERLVRDLLELSRLKDSHFQIEMEPVNLIDVLQETIRFLRQPAAAKSIAVTLSGDVSPYPVMGDYARLRQLFTILLDNAIKFSMPGSPVELILTQDGGRRAVSVRDHGVGISQQDLSHIFDRFYHQRSSGNAGGTGLGLPIAREIALRHGIELSCVSAPGEGTCFTLVFPPPSDPEGLPQGDG